MRRYCANSASFMPGMPPARCASSIRSWSRSWSRISRHLRSLLDMLEEEEAEEAEEAANAKEAEVEEEEAARPLSIRARFAGCCAVVSGVGGGGTEGLVRLVALLNLFR